MTVCEYQFARFNSRGGDDYLNRFAERLDTLFADGWTMLEAGRNGLGWWQVCLYREPHAVCGKRG